MKITERQLRRIIKESGPSSATTPDGWEIKVGDRVKIIDDSSLSRPQKHLSNGDVGTVVRLGWSSSAPRSVRNPAAGQPPRELYASLTVDGNPGGKMKADPAFNSVSTRNLELIKEPEPEFSNRSYDAGLYAAESGRDPNRERYDNDPDYRDGYNSYDHLEDDDWDYLEENKTMKISKRQLRKIIREEKQKLVEFKDPPGPHGKQYGVSDRVERAAISALENVYHDVFDMTSNQEEYSPEELEDIAAQAVLNIARRVLEGMGHGMGLDHGKFKI